MSDRERLVKAIEAFTKLFAEIQGNFLVKAVEWGLTAKQLLYLNAIAGLSEPTPGEIAGVLGLSKSSITAIIDNFVKLGCLQKVKSSADARSYGVRLTERGREVEALHRAVHEEIADLFLAKLNQADLVRLVELLERTARR